MVVAATTDIKATAGGAPAGSPEPFALPDDAEDETDAGMAASTGLAVWDTDTTASAGTASAGATLSDVAGSVLGAVFADTEAAALEADDETVGTRFADLGCWVESAVGDFDVGESGVVEFAVEEADSDEEPEVGWRDFDEADPDEEDLTEEDFTGEDLTVADLVVEELDDEFDVVESDVADEEVAEGPVDGPDDAEDVELEESAQATPQPPAMAAPIPSATAKPPTRPIYAPAFMICPSPRCICPYEFDSDRN